MKGFSIIEVMISSAIFLIVLAAQATQMVYAQRQYTSIAKRIDYTQAAQFINQVTSHTSLCSAVFFGQTMPVVGASVPTLTFAGDQVDDGPHNVFNNSIIIQSLKYSSVTTSGTTATAVMTLVANLQMPGGDTIIGGNVPAPISFPVSFNLAGAMIANCL